MTDPTLFSTLRPSRIWFASAILRLCFWQNKLRCYTALTSAAWVLPKVFIGILELSMSSLLSVRFIRLNDCAAVGTQVLFPAADK